MNDHDRQARKVASAFRDVMRRRHPDLTFEIGVIDRGRFRSFTTGPRQSVRLESTLNEPEAVLAPNPDHSEEAA